MAINRIDLMRPNPAQPLDLQSRQALLAQEQAIAQVLLAKSMENSSPTVRTGGGNPFARDIPNFGDPLARVAQAMMGKRQMDETNLEQTRLNQELQQRTQGELAAISNKQFGIEPPATPVDDEGNPNPMARSKGDIVQAFMMAQQGTTPGAKLRALELSKGMLTPEEAFKGADKFDIPTVAEALRTQDIGQLKPKIESKEYEGVVRPYQAGVPVGEPSAITQYGPAKKNALGVPVQTNLDTGKESSFGQFGDVSTNKHFQTKDIDLQFKAVEDGAKDYVLAGNNKAILEQVREDMKNVPEDAFGFLGGFKTTLGKAGEALGFDKLPETAGKEAIRSALGNISLQKARALAPVTEVDLKVLNEIIGSENNTKRALTRILDFMDQVTDREMKLHIGRVKNLSKKSADPEQFYNDWVPQFETGPIIKTNSPAANQYKDLSDQDILKRLRGG